MTVFLIYHEFLDEPEQGTDPSDKKQHVRAVRNSNKMETFYWFPESVSEIKRCVEEPGYLQQQIERYTPELLGRDVDTIVWQKMLAKMPHHGRAHDLLSRLKKKRQPFFNALIATAFLFPQAVGLLSPTFS